MSESRRHPPSARKLRRARRAGQVARSGEPTLVALLLGALALFALLGPSLLARVRQCFDLSLHTIARGGDPVAVARSCTVLAGEPLIISAAVVFALSWLSGFLQVGPLFSLRAFRIDLARLAPDRGFRRIASGLAWPLLKSLLKVALVGALSVALLASVRDALALLRADELGHVAGHAAGLGARTVLHSLAPLALLAVLDVLYQRHRLREELKMTQSELKRELRETEADALGWRRRERARRASRARAVYSHEPQARLTDG
ncbi:MAG: EscU/YscU/HrcU family type III secretion system export apparatus switch protein [Proteobacteria bacterium]|nr:EscU/YscU/HrcU family type III secretion system export apparatus switch protein [Pseudomonadota bacterium]